MSKRVLLICFAALCFLIWRHVSRPATSSRANLPQQVHTPTATQNAESPPPAPASAAPRSSLPTPAEGAQPAAEPEEEKFPSKEEFARELRKRPFAEWLKDGRPLKTAADLHDSGLNMGSEVGVIDTATGQIQYRYDVGYDLKEIGGDSCVGFTLADGKVVTGVFGEDTLRFYELGYKNAYAVAIRDRYFFVRYWDRTESRNFDREHNEPRNPFGVQSLLLFTRNRDGSFDYVGEVARWIYPPDVFDYKFQNLCEHTFQVDPTQ